MKKRKGKIGKEIKSTWVRDENKIVLETGITIKILSESQYENYLRVLTVGNQIYSLLLDRERIKR